MRYGTSTTFASVNEMERVTIYLGSRCNLNCAYCHREPDTAEPHISDELIDYIKSRPEIAVKFMGGEPTMYMDEIRRVVEAAPHAEFSITTNGILFPKYRDYFLRHRFFVCISYDGSGYDLRGYDPFRYVLNYPWLGVSCTLYHGNTDFSAIMKRFVEKEKIIGRSLSFFPHIMHETSSQNAPFALTREDMQEIYHQWRERIERLVEEYERYGIINRRYSGLFHGLFARMQAAFSFGETYCIHRNLRKVTADGRNLNCLYIRDDELSAGADVAKEEMQRLLRRRFPTCEHCHLYSMCGAACVKSSRHELECYFYRRLYGWFQNFYTEHRRACDELGRWF